MITPIESSTTTTPIFPTTGPSGPSPLGPPPAASGEGSFTDMIGNMINETQAAQNTADSAVHGLISGQTQDIHQVMLAMEQARLSMLMMVEMRNKVVEAYQELSRMPL
jgi:flagellar hook-basal body complex protein FliE